jgi:hypothetical protein
LCPEGFRTEGRILAFRNVHAAIAAERALKVKGFSLELIPSPREISSACGFCLFLPSNGGAAGPGAGHGAMPPIGSEEGLESCWIVYIREAGSGRRKERNYERED